MGDVAAPWHRRAVAMATVAAALLSGSACAASAPATPAWMVAMLNDVNARRAAVGVRPLSMCTALRTAATLHSTYQASVNTVTHSGAGGSSIGQRATRAGYLNWTRVRENVAGGQPSGPAAMAAWMASATHRDAILDPTLAHVGFGVALGADSRLYWTQDFGKDGRC